MSMYGEPEYEEATNVPDEFKPKQPIKAQPTVGADGHVDSNPSPVMGNVNDVDDDVPFIANPRRVAPVNQADMDFNPSPTFGDDRRHQSWVLDDGGNRKENDPNYRLVSTPTVPGGNALVDHYIEEAITKLGNGDKVGASQQISGAKTLVMMVKVQAERVKNQQIIGKMDDYLKTIANIETTINS